MTATKEIGNGECQQCKELARLLRTEVRVGDNHYDNANVLLEYVLVLRKSLRKYAERFHGNSPYHVGGAATFDRCQVRSCLEIRELLGTDRTEKP